ncbi:MAG: ABC transporter permease [Verrucomicrobiales bacterium]|nr:ABC transporter permease [Verrucomicrobiales bacterium]
MRQGFFKSLFSGWTWRMAWRDSRRHRGRLLLFSSSIVLGIAAMVAVGSFGQNLADAIEVQSRSLLGADLQVNSRQDFTEEQRELLDSLGEERSYQTTFSSMLHFPLSGDSRLVQIRALDGEFPYYGEVETEPVDGFERFKKGDGVLVEENLLLQFDAKVGDFVNIGAVPVPVVGALKTVPGENMVFATVAPRVFVPDDVLAASELIGNTSIARYRVYFRFDSPESLSAAETELNKIRRKNRWGVDTVEERKRELGNAMRNLNRFLNLVGFIALLLGAIGIASAIQLHVRQKLDSVGVLRCLGGGIGQTFAIYLIQAGALGFAGVIAGSAAGLAVQRYLPLAFQDFIPLEIEFAIHWWPVLRAAGVGFGICLLFALIPLMQVRRVSPLIVLRRSVAQIGGKDIWVGVLYLAIAAGVTGFAISQTRRWEHGVGFVVALAISILVLLVVAKFVRSLARVFIRSWWPFVVRQGMANLHRPNNRTGLLMLALGLGTFMILTLYLAQYGLVAELLPNEENNKPNAILFDIQNDQLAGVLDILKSQELPIVDVSPMVNMKLKSVKGEDVRDIARRPRRLEGDDGPPRRGPRGRRPPGWALRREYRSTYRSELASTEKILRGEWIAKASFDDEFIPISIEEGIARDLSVDLGDELVFDIQGLELTTKVASVREVEWRQIQANFFVVFPAGVLEDAPAFHIVTTRVADAEASARMQREVTREYANVSSIDLMLVLDVVQSIVSKITFGVRFMAFFTALTGVLLLITATLNSRYQRFREGILLRTMGANRAQILWIQFVEFSLLGIMASFTGILLAVGGQWALSSFVFEVDFKFPVFPVMAAVGANYLITVLVGILGTWGITRHPPLELLRAEA